VLEFEKRVPAGQLPPKSPHPKTVFPDVRIVKDHNGPLQQGAKPFVEIVLHGLVSMHTVNAQKVDATIGKMFPLTLRHWPVT